jgi:excisionase family DNA binding protein
MAQKFIGLDESAAQLGVSKDRLNELREAGKLRAYRDGASWKFRSEDIAKLAEEGLPPADSAASGLSLDIEAGEPDPEDSQIEVGEDASAAGAATSDLILEDIDEPTVPVDPSEEEATEDEAEIALADDASDISDSILLSEAELGESTDRPPSTIIGKAELDPEGDLSISTSSGKDPLASEEPPPAESGVLSEGNGLDDVLELEPPSPSESFENLEELDIDLEAESSRILGPEDRPLVKAVAEASAASDLELLPTDSDAAVLDSSVEVGAGATGSGLGLSGSSPIALEADEDDDQVLGDGSDITLSTESSGINIVSPSDSGLALDEVPLELSGSAALGSSLDLGSAIDKDVDLGSLGAGKTDAAAEEEPFALTPLGEETDEGEEDSSQIIALDEVSEEAGGAFLEEDAGAAPVLTEDFGAIGLTAGAAMVPGEPAVDTPFSIANIVSLSLCLVLLTICGMMTFDLLRNIWSWEGVTTLNSSVLEVLNPFLS